MATQQTTSTLSPDETNVRGMRSTINYMDCLSQGGFSDIHVLASLALFRVESPDGGHHLDEIAGALRLIQERAAEAQNDINCEAENVGCNFKGSDQKHRSQAFGQSQQTGGPV